MAWGREFAFGAKRNEFNVYIIALQMCVHAVSHVLCGAKRDQCAVASLMESVDESILFSGANKHINTHTQNKK